MDGTDTSFLDNYRDAFLALENRYLSLAEHPSQGRWAQRTLGVFRRDFSRMAYELEIASERKRPSSLCPVNYGYGKWVTPSTMGDILREDRSRLLEKYKDEARRLEFSVEREKKASEDAEKRARGVPVELTIHVTEQGERELEMAAA
jgi:hypothetical protein